MYVTRWLCIGFESCTTTTIYNSVVVDQQQINSITDIGIDSNKRTLTDWIDRICTIEPTNITRVGK